jgi:hypothetical protein
VDGVSWLLRQLKDMPDDELRDEMRRHGDDGEGWCSAPCSTWGFQHEHPCEVYQAVKRELKRRGEVALAG